MTETYSRWARQG